MLYKGTKYRNSYVDIEEKTTTYYFSAPKDIISKEYPEAEALEISVELPNGYNDAKFASVMFSPVKEGIPYNWYDMYLPYEDIENLLDLVPSMQIETLIAQVEEKNSNLPNGWYIVDSDTILADMIERVDYEFTGASQDIFNIWKNSFDKAAVEQMFYEFTDIEFKDYLIKCVNEIRPLDNESMQTTDQTIRKV